MQKNLCKILSCKGGFILSTLQSCLEKTIVKYKDKNIEVRAKEIEFGCWETWIKDLNTGREKNGAYCPGNPDYFIFDPKEKIWIFKKQLKIDAFVKSLIYKNSI